MSFPKNALTMHLTEEQTVTYEDNGPEGERLRRDMRYEAMAISKANDCTTVEIWSDDGIVFESYRAEQDEVTQ